MKFDEGSDPVTRWSQSQENLSGVGTVLTPFQKSLHNNLVASVKTLKTSLVRAAFFLAAVKQQGIHRLLGYATIGDYANASVGFTPAMTTQLLRMARKFPDFPLVARALENGQLTWSQAREICSRTDPADQQKWLEAAALLPRESLREAMDAARNVKRPPAPALPPAPRVGRSQRPRFHHRPAPAPAIPQAQAEQWHHLTFKFNSEQKGRWEKLMEYLHKGQSTAREEVLLGALHDAAFPSGQPREAGGPPYLVVLLECPRCGQATQPINRGEMPADTALLAAAHCDAMIEEADGTRRQVVAPRLRRLALRRARHTCEATGCGNTQFLEIHHRTPNAMGGGNSLENLVVLCSSCHRRLHADDSRAAAILRTAP